MCTHRHECVLCILLIVTSAFLFCYIFEMEKHVKIYFTYQDISETHKNLALGYLKLGGGGTQCHTRFFTGNRT